MNYSSLLCARSKRNKLLSFMRLPKTFKMLMMAVAAASAVISFSFQQSLLSNWNRSMMDYSSDHKGSIVDHRRPTTSNDIISTKRSTRNLNGDSQITVYHDDAVDENATARILNQTTAGTMLDDPVFEREANQTTTMDAAPSTPGDLSSGRGGAPAAISSNDITIPQNLTRSDLFSNNYFYRAWMGAEFPTANELPPFQVLETYIRQHSQQQLKHEWEDCESRNHCDAINSRKFVVGVYSCPVESGNRLHRFMNGLLWSVLTNRTLLARYGTFETCQEYGEAAKHCDKALEPSHCKEILHLSPWVPSFDEWNNTLLLPPIVRAEIPFRGRPDNLTQPYDNPTNPKVIRTGFQIAPDHQYLLSRRGISNTPHLSLPSNLERLEMIGKNGPYFAYGMMFEALFTMDPSLLPPKTNQVEDSSGIETYFLHSRHPKNGMDTYTWPEEMCIMKFENATTKTKPCLYYLMSDREVTLDLLKKAIQNKTHCKVRMVSDRSQGESFSNEHGPFAGRGYWEDVSLAIQARHGMIAFHMHKRHLVRTSTALVRELVEFRRVLEHSGGALPPFRECKNPWKE